MNSDGYCASRAPRRLVLGISGASGMPLALAVSRALNGAGAETHLVLSAAARRVLAEESAFGPEDLIALAHAHYDPDDLGAPPASGSWRHDGMIVCPCSMSSLGHIVSGAGVNLLHRAADVCLKEGRRLILVTRETPLSQVHLRNMLEAARAGAVVFPPNPAFYARPRSLEEMLDNMAGRILDCAGVEHACGTRWA